MASIKFLRYKFLFFFILFCILSLFSIKNDFLFYKSCPKIGNALQAQIADNNLPSLEQKKEFEITLQSLTCLCGCNFTLNVCPHVECPWGIPIRQFIEHRIREGAKSEDILLAFEKGFGKELLNDSLIKKWIDADNFDIYKKEIAYKLVDGYGSKVLAHNSFFSQLIPFLIILFIGILIIGRWWRLNKKKS